MRLRIADRVLVAIAGLLLLACCAAIVAQMFFNVDLVSFAARVFSSDSPRARAALIALAVFLLLLGIYCVFVLFRHRRRKDKFILQKTEDGELVISVKALENMVQKCLDQYEEIDAQHLYLENQKDGLLIRIRGSVAGGISIPLTVEALQKQIRQYVTACSGIEIKGIRVQIESSGEDAKDAPFAIAAPAAQPLLREGESKSSQVHPAEEKPVEEKPAEPAPEQKPAPKQEESAPRQEEPAPKPAPAPVAPVEEEDDDRPLHQRLFSPKQEPCIVPEPPAEPKNADMEVDTTPSETEASDTVPENTDDIAEDISEVNGMETDSTGADPEFLESLKAFDDLITAEKEED